MPDFKAQAIAVQGYALALGQAVEQTNLYKVAIQETQAVAVAAVQEIGVSVEATTEKVRAMTVGITESGAEASEKVVALGVQVGEATDRVRESISMATGEVTEAAKGISMSVGAAIDEASQEVTKRGTALRDSADKVVEEARGSLTSGLKDLENELDEGVLKLNRKAGDLDIEKTFEAQGAGLRRMIDEGVESMDEFIAQLKAAGDEGQQALAKVLEGVEAGLFSVKNARDAVALFGQEALALFDQLDPSKLKKGIEDILRQLEKGKGTADEVARIIEERLGSAAEGVRDKFLEAREQGADALRFLKDNLDKLAGDIDPDILARLLEELIKREEGNL